jgi:hypothetical protein
MVADAEGSAFVGGGDEPEQQLRGGVVERGEPELVDDHVVVTGCRRRDRRCVGEDAVEGFDELSGADVADSMPGGDDGDADHEE